MFNKPKAKIDKIIKVKYPTHLKDLKVGDIVITAELHQITEIRNADWILCTEVGDQCPYIKHTGWGQQGILKVIGGVEKRSTQTMPSTENVQPGSI